jgi:acetyltransferase
MLPEESSIRNPVDMIASANEETYERALEYILNDPKVDAVIVIFVPPIMVEPLPVVERITASASKFDKPVFNVLMAEDHHYDAIPKTIPEAPPQYRFPESAVRALAAMKRYRLWLERPEGIIPRFEVDDVADTVIANAPRGDQDYLRPDDVNRILGAYGFPVCRAELVPLDANTAEAAERIGYPVALKVFGKSIIHKSDFGGVALGIEDEKMLEAAKNEMIRELEATGVADDVEGLMVQEMAVGGKEVIFGMTTDPKFGPVLMFGMGGKYVEIIKDITFRVMPVTDIDAWEMVKGIKSYPLLEGVRGEVGVDLDFIVESIQRLAQLVDDVPCILELDMNPVIVTPDRASCRVVDARIRACRP